TNDDLVAARRLIDADAAAIMPLRAPIGSGMGIQNTANLRILREMITEVPFIVDAGVGTASDATVAMELGADAVLMNTAIALARDPVAMAHAMRLGVEAGRLAYRAGRIARKAYASASSPLDGTISPAVARARSAGAQSPLVTHEPHAEAHRRRGCAEKTTEDAAAHGAFAAALRAAGGH